VLVGSAVAQMTDWEKEQFITGMAKFTMVDSDNDGMLSREEFYKMGEKHYEGLEDRNKKRFDAGAINRLLEEEFAMYDKDFSGALSAAEWEKVTLWHITRKKDEIVTERSFHKCDKNNDLKLSVEEVNEYFSAQGYNEEELDVLMILGDADKDKHMTFEEFKKGRSDLQKVMEIDKKEAEEREKNKVRPDMPNEDAITEFDKHDENKNGQLTPQEFIKLIRSQVNTVDKDGNVIEIPEEGIIKTFKKYDTNKDISVSKEEFTAKIANIVPDATALHDFDASDTNKDGFLTPQEYTTLFEAFATVMGHEKIDSDVSLATYKKHDLNGDGKLSSQEYLLSIKLMKADADREYDQKMKEEMEKDGGEGLKPPPKKGEL